MSRAGRDSLESVRTALSNHKAQAFATSIWRTFFRSGSLEWRLMLSFPPGCDGFASGLTLWRRGPNLTWRPPWLLAGSVSLVLLGSSWTRAAGLAADVSVPGASARLGFGGGWWPGEWASLDLQATARGVFHLHATGVAGTLRVSLGAWTADLDVPDGPGVRVTSLPLPLFSERPLTVTLSGPTGSTSATLRPYSTAPVLDISGTVNPSSLYLGLTDVQDAPGYWLAGPSVHVPEGELAPPPDTLMGWVAGGALVAQEPARLRGLSAAPTGNLGLGGFGGAVAQARLNWPALWRGITPALTTPSRGGGQLGLWAAGVFILALIAYSAKRFDAATFYGSVLAAAAAGLLGMLAFQPAAREASGATRLLAGAGGWGVEFILRSQFLMGGGVVTFVAGSYPLDDLTRSYDPSEVRVRLMPWQVARAVEMPHSAIVPLVMHGRSITNTGARTLEDVFVVGFGRQERLPSGKRSVIAVDALSYPPDALAGLVAALPNGAALARDGGTLIIALPDGGAS